MYILGSVETIKWHPPIVLNLKNGINISIL